MEIWYEPCLYADPTARTSCPALLLLLLPAQPCSAQTYVAQTNNSTMICHKPYNHNAFFFLKSEDLLLNVGNLQYLPLAAPPPKKKLAGWLATRQIKKLRGGPG